MTLYSLHVHAGSGDVIGRCVARGDAPGPTEFGREHARKAGALPDRFDHDHLRVDVREGGRTVACQTLFPEERMSDLRDFADRAGIEEFEEQIRPAFEDLGLEGDALDEKVREWEEKRRKKKLQEALEGASTSMKEFGEALSKAPAKEMRKLVERAESGVYDALVYGNFEPRKSALRLDDSTS